MSLDVSAAPRTCDMTDALGQTSFDDTHQSDSGECSVRRGILEIADLFCGAGGTSTGALAAAKSLGYAPRLTAINHWPTAVATHEINHPGSRHVCASVDSINPRHLYPNRKLDLLWASPECTHHSRARGGKPMSDQSRASGHCVTRWAEALRPEVILVENVREFLEWGPIGSTGRPLAAMKGATFRAWVGMLESLGYRVEWRVLCAADFGDPTTRERLFVQAVRGRRRITWPMPTHRPASADPDLFGSGMAPWRAAREIIDWALPSRSIFTRNRPLRPKTMRRIMDGLSRFGVAPSIICMEHRGSIRSVNDPLPTITTARCGAFALAEPCVLPQQSGGRLRPVSEPLPTVSTSGAIGLVEPFLVEYYGTGGSRRVTEPLSTVTTKSRFGLAQPEIMVDGQRYLLDVRFRMLQPHELAGAQGFPKGYRFQGTKADAVRQIGNAVPCGLARALVDAVLRCGLKSTDHPHE